MFAGVVHDCEGYHSHFSSSASSSVERRRSGKSLSLTFTGRMSVGTTFLLVGVCEGGHCQRPRAEIGSRFGRKTAENGLLEGILWATKCNQGVAQG